MIKVTRRRAGGVVCGNRRRVRINFQSKEKPPHVEAI